ncbi:hypothetical protein M422DRAFT_26773 [Sphaerobolus stellatus SS14]|nr:hypothetical protein M422DRAFT_26773 [Sphaerobolus stellatus SS14]
MQPPLVLRLFVLLRILSLVTAQLAACPVANVDVPHNTTSVATTHTGSSLDTISQFLATDGGSGVLNRVVWIVFSAVVALPLGAAGVRLGRIVIGTTIGLIMSFSVWVAFVNTLRSPFDSDNDNSDLILTVIIISIFAIFTFVGTFIRALRPYGLGLLGVCGGATFFIRIVILRAGLLIPTYAPNIVLIALGAFLGLIGILYRRRLAAIISTALISTFFGALGLDLAIHINSPPGEGQSRGLPLLLDRNPAHRTDLLVNAYNPTVATQVIIGLSIAIVPILGYLQHRLYPGDFEYALRRKRETILDDGGMDFNDGDLFQAEMGVRRVRVPQGGIPSWVLFQSRFSLA